MSFDKAFLGILILVLGLFSACDCFVSHRGFVLNERTNDPIINAVIVFDNKRFTTDTNGYFEFSYVTGFCPEEKYHVTKQDFRDFELLIEYSDESVTYEVFDKSEFLPNGYSNSNSNSFEVRNDTLFFYMEPTSTP